MLRSLKKKQDLSKLVHWLLIVTFAMAPMVFVPKTAEAKQIWYYQWPPEDPELRRIVFELIEVVKVLWKMLWSFEWLKHPRKFYRVLKKVFKVWFRLMRQLVVILGSYIRQLESEIQSGWCDTPDCANYGR